MKKVWSMFLALGLLFLCSCSKTQTQQFTINDIIEQSDGCIMVNTLDYKERMTQEGDTYYTQVLLGLNNLENPPVGDPPDLVTIIQEGENYIKQDERYIIFVKRSETDENHFYVTGGKSGVIKLERDFTYDRDEYEGLWYNNNGYKYPISYLYKYKCLDKNMQTGAEELLGKYYDQQNFSQWLADTGDGRLYYRTGYLGDLIELSFDTETCTTEPIKYKESNTITTIPDTED